MHKPFRKLFSLVCLAAVLESGGAAAGDKIGVLLMHGKKGTPEHVQTLAQDLRRAGYLVETPDMPWSKERAYDKTIEDAYAEIDRWVARLKRAGAGRVVVAGHSMGGNMALGYAATHSGIDALIAIGPGQTVEAANFRDALGESVARAKTLVGEGRGGEEASFADLHLGKTSTISAKASIYVSYFDPEGLANMPAMAPKIAVPTLWLVGTEDQGMMAKGKAYVFDRLPPNPLNRYQEVPSDHMGTPQASSAAILAWLRTVFQ